MNDIDTQDNASVRKVEWLQCAVNIILAAVGFTAMCIYGRQLTVFKGQFHEMQEQTRILNAQAQQAAQDATEASKAARQQLAISQRQSEAATTQATAALRASNVQQKQLELLDRPWMTVEITGSIRHLRDAVAWGPITLRKGGVDINLSLKICRAFCGDSCAN